MGRKPIADRKLIAGRKPIADRKSIAGREPTADRKPIADRKLLAGRKSFAGRYVSNNALAEKRFIYILIDVDFIRTKTRVRGPIFHISGQNSPYDMKTEVLTHVNVQ